MLFYNNLVLNNKIEIPSNDKEKFIFKKHGDYSQKIIFNIDNVILDNLYVLLQSYLGNKEIRSIKIYTFIEEKSDEKKTTILSYSNIFIVKKMNFFYFCNGGDNRSNYDKKYVSEDYVYGIIVVFSKNSIINFVSNNNFKINDLYSTLKPNYPGNEGIMNILNSFK